MPVLNCFLGCGLVEIVFLFLRQIMKLFNETVNLTSFEQLLLANGLVSVVSVIGDVLQQILVQRSGRREGREAVGEQEPASLAVLLVVVLPRLQE